MKKPIPINNANVEIVSSYKYLGVVIQNNLKWDLHVSTQLKKANKRMYHVRCLRKMYVDNKIICLFYNSVVSSVLTYAISSWFCSCSEKLKKDINKYRKNKIVNNNCHQLIETPNTVFKNKCMSLISKIVNDSSHPLNTYLNVMPHGK